MIFTLENLMFREILTTTRGAGMKRAPAHRGCGAPALDTANKQRMPAMTIHENITLDESLRLTIDAAIESPATPLEVRHEIVRIYHYWRENSKGDLVDQEIEVEGPIRTRESATGHHYIETINGFGMIMPPGWSFFESHPKHGCSPFGE
jgi:hypothetical protein